MTLQRGGFLWAEATGSIFADQTEEVSKIQVGRSQNTYLYNKMTGIYLWGLWLCVSVCNSACKPKYLRKQFQKQTCVRRFVWGLQSIWLLLEWKSFMGVLHKYFFLRLCICVHLTRMSEVWHKCVCVCVCVCVYACSRMCAFDLILTAASCRRGSEFCPRLLGEACFWVSCNVQPTGQQSGGCNV